MLFEIKGLTKVYGDRTVLDIPKLGFQKGIIYSLQGPNGSGKTTLLEILSLLLPPTAGRLKYNDTDIDLHGNNLTALRREIVMVQQKPLLFTTTVYKNLEFGLMVRGMPKDEKRKIIEASLDLVDMRDFMTAEAHRLSGGETQRVAIAQALACSPKVMLLDEPTANVDVENQIAVERIIEEINSQRNISVIFTTHDLTQASRLSHRVISLFEGRNVLSLFENIFGGRIVQEENGDKCCLVRDKVRLMMKTEKTGYVKFSIDPLKIRIFKEKDRHTDTNILKGKLIQLSDERKHVRATADVGIPLNILLPKDEIKKRALYVGDEVNIFCPADGIQVL
jgi:tungstate transport system ATP-binding protein